MIQIIQQTIKYQNMKQFIYSLAVATTLLSTVSCDDNEIIDTPIPDSQKEMISFSLSDGTSQTRAGFTGGETRIIARMQSDEKDGTGVKYTKCVLKAYKDETGGTNDFSNVEYMTTGETRYWDDAFGRKGQISVYAVAIPNSTVTTKLTEDLITGESTWTTEATPNNTIAWSVSTDQSGNPLASEDLVYSKNIQENGKDGCYKWDYRNNNYPDLTGATTHENGCLVFTQATGAAESDAGHFDKGHLVFNHSLSRLTITLQEGAGFDGNNTNATDFKFNSGNITLLNMNTSGTLDIREGTWASINPTNISKMATTSTTGGANGTYAAQMLPGYKFYGTGANATKNVMQYVIDNNTYYVTQKQIYDALNVTENTSGAENAKVKVENDGTDSYIEMKQGKNYVLTIKVDKTGISSITATLANWVEVTGSTSVNNAHLTFTMTASGSACNEEIDLYRLGDNNPNYDADNFDFSYQGTNWFGDYKTDANCKTTLLQTNKLGEGQWSTSWYFESNKTYYHFRTVNKDTEIKGNTDNTKDYFEISGGVTASTDPHWGAPMQTATDGTAYLKYDETNGYEKFLMPAIGATESKIAIQEIHMMSNINVILKTKDDGGKVMLKDGDNTTKVTITRLATSGTVEMGRGVVTPVDFYTGQHDMTVPSTYYKTDEIETEPYTFTVVPQSLSRNFNSTSDEDYVGLFIQTPDNNQYYVVKKLSQIIAFTVDDQRNQIQGQAITRWYPGHSYTYTITISKKGIEAITCTVADWVNVTGKDINIDLES